MSGFTSQQRKIAYILALVLLSIPIVTLGMPAGEKGENPGGTLAQMRNELKLGEPTMGDVDPSGATMNLVLLGLRGLATDLLWLDYQHLQETKNWAQMRSTVESIILLQPHFKRVWQHNGWNLAWNVSAEWDAVEDRYYWVKEGAKFLKKGGARNQNVAEIFWDYARVLGQKIGMADEKRFYREYFKSDPDKQKYEGGPDPELNPSEKDNYLAARDGYLVANEIELTYPQRARHRVVFRQYPAHSLLSYAGALQSEGTFGERTRSAWQEAFRAWTGEFGQETFRTRNAEVRLEMDDQAVASEAQRQNLKPEDIRTAVDFLQNLINYRYWRLRALSESEEVTENAHREIYEGQLLFKEAKLNDAKKKLESGLTHFEEVLKKFPTIGKDDDVLDEILTAQLYWRYILQLRQEPVPNNYPLKQIWDQNQARIPELDRNFKRDNGI